MIYVTASWRPAGVSYGRRFLFAVSDQVSGPVTEWHWPSVPEAYFITIPDAAYPVLGLDNTVYLPYQRRQGGSYLAAVRNGLEQWNFPLESSALLPPVFTVTGKLFVVTANKVLHIISADGTEQSSWPLPIPTHLESISVGADEMIYIADPNSVFKINPRTETVEWSSPIPGQIVTEIAIGVAGKLYLGHAVSVVVDEQQDGGEQTTVFGYRLAALDPLDGRIVWEYPPTVADDDQEQEYLGRIECAPTFDRNGIVYLAAGISQIRAPRSSRAKIHALLPTTGAPLPDPLWQPPDLDSHDAKSMLVGELPTAPVEPMIYIGTNAFNSSRLYAIEPTGDQAWVCLLGAQMRGNPVLGYQGEIYVTTSPFLDGQLVAIWAELTDPASSSWPMFRANRHNTGVATLQGASVDWTAAYARLFNKEGDLRLLREARGKLVATPRGRSYINLLYGNSHEALNLLLKDPELLAQARSLIETNREAVQSMVRGKEGVVGDSGQVIDFLESFAAKSDGALAYLSRTIAREMREHREAQRPFLGFTLK
jgi:outer membrane protein assembly factor BamB